MDYAQIKRQGKLFAQLPTEIAYAGCVWCVAYFALLDHPDNRQKGLSIAKLAVLSHTSWETANGHVREHLAAARWVTVIEPTGPGGKAVVKVAHNPARDLHATHARPLAEMARTKPASTRKPKTSPITARNLSDNREVPIGYPRGSSPITASFEREPSVLNLSACAQATADVAASKGGDQDEGEVT